MDGSEQNLGWLRIWVNRAEGVGQQVVIGDRAGKKWSGIWRKIGRSCFVWCFWVGKRQSLAKINVSENVLIFINVCWKR